MGEFNSVSKFRLQLADDDGSRTRVVVQIGLDGFKILDDRNSRTMRSLELGHISRWQSRGRSLILYTKTPVDVEERQLTLEGDDTTIRNALDTLTCSCMQLAELLQNKQTEVARETVTSLNALVAGGGKKKSKLPTADEVEYWRSPEKAGWMQSQGEHIKSWRKRWFVLKQGFLFRFMNNNVSESVKPRGVVDLSKVQDVKPGSSVTGKPNSIQLKTSSGGSVCYITDTETELVEWMSALEGAMQRIVRHAAGLEEEPQPQVASRGGTGRSSTAAKAGSGTPNASEWMKQLERTMESFEQTTVSGSGKSGKDKGHSGGRSGGGPAMVSVVGYETLGSSGGSGGGASSRGGYGGSSQGGYGSGAASHNGSSLYGHIAGANVVTNDTALNYGTAAIANDPYISSTPSYPTPAQQQYSAQSQQQYSAPQQQYSAPRPQPYSPSQQYTAQQYTSPQQQQQQAGSYYSAPAATSGYGQQPVVSAAAATSLMDQLPQQQPTYPYFQQQASAPQPQQASSWQVHHTAEGRPYYHNPATGSTQWEAPMGFAA